MSRYRNPTAYVLGVLVLLAAIVLATPNGGTRASWYAAGQAEVPTVTTGRIGFGIGTAAVESSATLTNTSGFGVRFRPVQVSLVDSAGVPVAPPADLRFDYRTGTDCGDADAPVAWSAVAPGGAAPVAVLGETRAPLERDRPAELCLTVSADAVDEDALRPPAGRALHVVTQVEAVSLGDGTWSTTRSWTVPFAVEPQPMDPPSGITVPGPVATEVARCGVDHGAATLRWTWTDHTGAPAVTEWQIRVRPAGTTEETTLVKTVPGATTRETRLTAKELRATGHDRSQDYEVLVRAVLAAGDTTHVDSSSAWKIKTPGESGHINCEGLPS